MASIRRDGFNRHLFARIGYVERELGVSRPAATEYFHTLAARAFLGKQRIGENNFYLNQRSVALFVEGAS